ncbi:MAG: septum formation family protein [Chloroflexota bacterium]|nr:septum formation family protein [Chloroflexota bacterium]
MTPFVRLGASMVAVAVLAGCGLLPGGGGGDQVSAFDLEPGVCFDDVEGDSVESLPRVPCEQTHNNEVFAVVDYPAGGDEAYPGDSAMQSYAEEECKGSRFEDYVGIDYASSIYEVFPITPSEESWSSGDREIICSLYDPRDNEMEGSVRGTAE